MKLTQDSGLRTQDSGLSVGGRGEPDRRRRGTAPPPSYSTREMGARGGRAAAMPACAHGPARTGGAGPETTVELLLGRYTDDDASGGRQRPEQRPAGCRPGRRSEERRVGKE